MGHPHPDYFKAIYPRDYGYLAGTHAANRDAIDVWIGTTADRTVAGLMCTADLSKRKMDVKLLIGGTRTDVALIEQFFGRLQMSCRLALRPEAW